ncbi:excalibur calcium-binding domain-containing protein [Pseudarthrobacter sp. ATCC 49987]
MHRSQGSGSSPIRADAPGYHTALDRDRDGIACDK